MVIKEMSMQVRKIYGVILMLLFLVVGFSGRGQKIEKNKIDKEGNKQGYWEETSNYESLIIPSDCQQRIQKGSYKDGQKTGIWKFYLCDQIITEETFVDGKRNGVHKAYYKNGQLRAEGKVVHNENTDEHTWNPGSNKYFDCDLKEGVWKYYGKKGKLLSEATYKGNLVINRKFYTQ